MAPVRSQKHHSNLKASFIHGHRPHRCKAMAHAALREKKRFLGTAPSYCKMCQTCGIIATCRQARLHDKQLIGLFSHLWLLRRLLGRLPAALLMRCAGLLLVRSGHGA